MEETLRRACIERLKEELVPAMGCTEPIAVAYAAALAKKTLGMLPERPSPMPPPLRKRRWACSPSAPRSK